MWKVDIDKAQNWNKINVGKLAYFSPSTLDVACPYPECGRSMVNLVVRWGSNGYHTHTNLVCTGCKESTQFFIVNPPKTTNEEDINQTVIYQYPEPPSTPSTFEKGVAEISPMFVEIYNQAHRAELLGLNQLVGIGYRKALEFLIKDYCCLKKPDSSEKIKKLSLGTCINNYVDDPRIQKMAERAAWLGNDETHYVRKFTDKDVSALICLIQLTRHWISMEYLTEEWINELEKR